MRTIDARDLDVPTEELLVYLRVNISRRVNTRMSIPYHEQMIIIITPTQLENIRSAQTGSLSYHEGYPASFMGVPVEIKNRTAETRAFPEPIPSAAIDAAIRLNTQEEAVAKMFMEYAKIFAEEQIDDYIPKKPKKPKTKVSKKETEQPRQRRHVPVWKD